uniref:Protein phosphatase 1 regulatory subunit 14D n=1 Tax=Nothoprocta perdicaria TaxID=30464 RepID=A0A8C6YXN9_NOTPE
EPGCCPSSVVSPTSLPGLTNAARVWHLRAARCRQRLSKGDAEEEPGEFLLSERRKLGKLTIKYNRKDLQRWLELEEWINAQLQELYQYQVRTPEPEIDLEDLLEVPNEEQKLKLQVFISSVIWKRSSGVSAAYYLGIS